jgi:hypothetical protein
MTRLITWNMAGATNWPYANNLRKPSPIPTNKTSHAPKQHKNTLKPLTH